MQWLALNWVWILFLGGMIAMHVFGMGCHAGHGKHNRRRGDAQDGEKTEATAEAQSRPPHQH